MEAYCPIITRNVGETTELLQKELSQGSDENSRGELWKKREREKKTLNLSVDEEMYIFYICVFSF